jgi:hypothetical protein
MPRTTEWFHRLPAILESLERVDSPFVDRAALQVLFETSARQATRILHRLGASRSGGALMLEREKLLAHLKLLEQDETIRFEQDRRVRLSTQLEQAQKEIRARRIRIAAPPAEQSLRIGELPRDIHLAAGNLQIRFTNSVDLLEKLLLLAQTISEDWNDFESRMLDVPPKPNTITRGASFAQRFRSSGETEKGIEE